MSKILIIDDDVSIRKLLKAMFEKSNYEVVDAADGEEGIKQFKKYLPDLVITDLIMPGKEGLETIKDIKNINPNSKIIAMSGGGTVEPDMYLKLAKSMGASHVFSKPINSSLLLSTIAEILKSV